MAAPFRIFISSIMLVCTMNTSFFSIFFFKITCFFLVVKTTRYRTTPQLSFRLSACLQITYIMTQITVNKWLNLYELLLLLQT